MYVPQVPTVLIQVSMYFVLGFCTLPKQFEKASGLSRTLIDVHRHGSLQMAVQVHSAFSIPVELLLMELLSSSQLFVDIYLYIRENDGSLSRAPVTINCIQSHQVWTQASRLSFVSFDMYSKRACIHI